MNWFGTSRSNFFAVADAAAFTQAMASFDVHPEWNDQGHVALVATTDQGDWPQLYDADEEPIDDGFWSAVAPHLADGAVAVFQTVGGEGDHMTGYAAAVDKTGEVVEISIDDIFTIAQQRFGIAPSRVVC